MRAVDMPDSVLAVAVPGCRLKSKRVAGLGVSTQWHTDKHNTRYMRAGWASRAGRTGRQMKHGRGRTHCAAVTCCDNGR